MDVNTLRNIFIFSDLSHEDAEFLLSISKVKEYKKGSIIFFDTEPYQGFYVVLEGLVKIYKISKDGKEHIVHIVDEYNTFAEVPLFENSGRIFERDFRYPANAMAIEDETILLFVQARPFLELVYKNPPLCLKMLSGFAKRLKHLNNHVSDITLKDVTKRVCGYLYNEYVLRQPKQDETIINRKYFTLHVPKIHLASYLGTIPETLSRTFKKLQDDGTVEVNGKQIRVLDVKKLKEYSE
jgi:CRP/FNR family transcriptional regulator